ncbi:MAG: hypothetical protein NXI20_05640 [bacterium]|nr:hypothetical protein [bacterium]
MGWGKGKTEKGQGGKLGHSNRDGWGYHDEEKVISKKQRRLEQQRFILDERSKLDEDLRSRTKTIIEALELANSKYQVHEFDSGGLMIDFSLGSEFYCIQMYDNKFGLSKIDDNPEFSSIPDSGYIDWIDFKEIFDNILS